MSEIITGSMQKAIESGDLQEALKIWFNSISRYNGHHIEAKIKFLDALNTFRKAVNPSARYITEAVYVHWRKKSTPIPQYLEKFIETYIQEND